MAIFQTRQDISQGVAQALDVGLFERLGTPGGLEIAAGLIGCGHVQPGEDDAGFAREGFEPELLGAFVLAVEVGAVLAFEAFGEAAGFPVGGFVQVPSKLSMSVKVSANRGS